jgi:putative sigma-54 modulation protein
MKIHITGRQLRLTKAIRDYVETKVLKAQRYFHPIIWAQIMLSIEKHVHQAEIVLHAPKQTFRALAQAADLYAAVDLASHKIDHQLKKYKERIQSRQKNSYPVGSEALPEQASVRIAVVKKVPLRPMSHNDAVLEMEKFGYNFWLFQDRESRQVHVIYRHTDDSYGVLKPVKRER